jgi:hypothetical protein
MQWHAPQVLLCCTYRNVIKGDASLGRLLELGLVLAKLHGATHAAEGAAHAAALSLNEMTTCERQVLHTTRYSLSTTIVHNSPP